MVLIQSLTGSRLTDNSGLSILLTYRVRPDWQQAIVSNSFLNAFLSRVEIDRRRLFQIIY